MATCSHDKCMFAVLSKMGGEGTQLAWFGCCCVEKNGQVAVWIPTKVCLFGPTRGGGGRAGKFPRENGDWGGVWKYPLCGSTCEGKTVHIHMSPKLLAAGRSLRNQIFFCQGTPLRTTPRDHQPPTANSDHPPTAANRHPPTASHQPPPTASGDQPPTANHYQPLPTSNHQSPTATNRQLPTANHQSPPTMVEHMECPRAFLGKLCNGTLFFFVKDRPG